jgi:hypothetical protein
MSMTPQVEAFTLELSVTRLELLITLLESLIMNLENIYSTGITHDNHHMMIVIGL